MGRKTVKTERATPAPMLARCRAEVSVLSLRLEYSRRFGPGELVDLEEEIAPGVRLRTLVREDCFEELAPEVDEPKVEVDDDDTDRA